MHQTFLIFLHQSLTDYSFELTDVKNSFGDFEGNESGFIDESFLRDDIQKGIDRSEEMPYALSNDINQEMNTVSDLVPLSPLVLEELEHQAEKGREYATSVAEQLQEVDDS